MMATVPHVISGLGLRNFQADGFLLTRVYMVAQKSLDTTDCRPICLVLYILQYLANLARK